MARIEMDELLYVTLLGDRDVAIFRRIEINGRLMRQRSEIDIADDLCGEKMVALKSVAQIVAVRFVSLDSFYVKYHSKAYDKNRGAWPSVVPRTSSVLAAQFLC